MGGGAVPQLLVLGCSGGCGDDEAPLSWLGWGGGMSSLHCRPPLDGLGPGSPPPEARAAAPPYSAPCDPIQPGRMIQGVIYKPTPLTWAAASPSWCLLAWGRGVALAGVAAEHLQVPGLSPALPLLQSHAGSHVPAQMQGREIRKF